MYKLTVDPGHGDKDPGAVGPSGVQEKVITLAVAKKVVAILRPVMSVALTRYEDIQISTNLSVDLTKRAELANFSLSDVFVSIHCNAATDPSAHGTETHCYPKSVRGKTLAGMIQGRLIPALGLTNRGVKESNFAVLRQSQMPAALVELAFISNPTEEALLESEAFQDKAALAIAQGICDFLGIAVPKQEMLPPDGKRQTNDIKIIVFGREVPGVLIGDRAYAPVRDLVDAIGVKESVTWNPATRTVTVG